MNVFELSSTSLTGHGPALIQPGDPRIAIAALCIQVMEADGEIHEKERKDVRLDGQRIITSSTMRRSTH